MAVIAVIAEIGDRTSSHNSSASSFPLCFKGFDFLASDQWNQCQLFPIPAIPCDDGDPDSYHVQHVTAVTSSVPTLTLHWRSGGIYEHRGHGKNH
jgi:hypothetical protein